ncbi:hypothetical protein G7046_g1586 [Stylonectria norvegica]|nr:hypothetical protein G7046_g1586 [Stylonectria norvegica]
MSPSVTEQPSAQIDMATMQQQQQPSEPVETGQPQAHRGMDPQQPHPESDVSMRGGDRGGCCPGRFCFCVPCPLPCDFCII